MAMQNQTTSPVIIPVLGQSNNPTFALLISAVRKGGGVPFYHIFYEPKVID